MAFMKNLLKKLNLDNLGQASMFGIGGAVVAEGGQIATDTNDPLITAVVAFVVALMRLVMLIRGGKA